MNWLPRITVLVCAMVDLYDKMDLGLVVTKKCVCSFLLELPININRINYMADIYNIYDSNTFHYWNGHCIFIL